MSDQDESMNETESEEHEEEEEEDSSSESVDEEIKLNQNFINTLQKISIEQGKNYDDFILLLDIAYDLNDLDKIRQSIELFSSAFPLSPDIWLKYLSVELTVAQTDAELEQIGKIFQKALDDYYSIDVALEYAKLASKVTVEKAKEIWDILLPAYGYEFTKGRLIWEAWREHFDKTELDSSEKVRKIIKKYKEELLLPLSNMSATYTSFREYLEKNDSQLEKKFDREAFDVEVKNTKKILQKVLPFEQKLAKLDDKAHRERVETFKQYIAECAEDLEEEYVQVLYERMITACCLNETAWILYVNFIQNRSSEWKPLESNKSKIFLQTDLDIINRGLRNCNWSAELYVEKMRILEANSEPRNVIQSVLEEAVQIQYNSPEPIVKIWIEYLTYLSRVTNFSDEKQIEILRNNFNLAWDTLGRQFGNLADPNCEILKLWGTIEYTKINDYARGKQLWNSVMESNENPLRTALWIELVQLELKCRGADAARSILKRAIKINDLNDVVSLISYWNRFERCNGTLEQLKDCQKVCDKTLQQYQKRNFKKDFTNNKRKTDDTKKDGKRKADNYMDENDHKNKKLKDKDGATEDFQKLSISATDKINSNTTSANVDRTNENAQVFLSNLDTNITLAKLQETFPELNIIKFEMASNRKGKSGYGFAELSHENDVKKALDLDRRPMDGRPVFISLCERDKSHRQKGFKYSTTIEPNKIFVKGISYDATEDDLKKLFGECGIINSCRIVTNKFGKSKGIAYIEFEEESSAKNAVIKVDQKEFMGKKMTVAISEPPAHDKSKVLPAKTPVSDQKNFVARSDQKSRISFIPASVQKAQHPSQQSATSSNQPAKSNDDFRKMLMK
ncbi:hypothetical protein PVAND_002822 [Polypedilum vanderplanki]|uniref:RRM domain-containing protein n=1 Tax=Polypedilum vanderplanki TaxID=319348 RepID=A0A9J6BS66_POLVA|nr:hypothetical protein PVAND_002822 [Polypedilum vanderplanki]